MTMHRRNFLSLTAAGAAGIGLGLLGSGQARAAAGPQGAPGTQFAVGVRQYSWTRGSRKINTYVYYPAKGGKPGGGPVNNAPVADGVFPVCEYTHGSGGSPQGSLSHIQGMAAAGFIVPAPYFRGVSVGDATNGNLGRDVSEVITRTLALNTGSDPLQGHVDTKTGVGVYGYSMGGMTTHSLLTKVPDPRIVAAAALSCVDMGTPAASVHAKVLFIHGDKDQLCPYSSARQAYKELPAPKAFLTMRGADHSSYFRDSRARSTFVDWMRWGLYADLAARDRLPKDASSSATTWESALG